MFLLKYASAEEDVRSVRQKWAAGLLVIAKSFMFRMIAVVLTSLLFVFLNAAPLVEDRDLNAFEYYRNDNGKSIFLLY